MNGQRTAAFAKATPKVFASGRRAKEIRGTHGDVIHLRPAVAGLRRDKSVIRDL